MRDHAAYQGYLIEPTPKQLRVTGECTLEIQIARDFGGERRGQLFTAKDTFPTRDEAVAGGVRFGRAIIDGEVAGCAMLF